MPIFMFYARVSHESFFLLFGKADSAFRESFLLVRGSIRLISLPQ